MVMCLTASPTCGITFQYMQKNVSADAGGTSCSTAREHCDEERRSRVDGLHDSFEESGDVFEDSCRRAH